MRGQHIGRLNISPVEYNPVKNLLKVYDEIELQITFHTTNGIITSDSKAKTYSPAFQQLNSAFINAEAYQFVPTMGVQYPVKYVIVADSMFRNSLQPFS